MSRSLTRPHHLGPPVGGQLNARVVVDRCDGPPPPGAGYTAESPLRPVLPSRRSTHEPKNSDPRSFCASHRTPEPRGSHSCLSRTPLPAIPSTSAESRSSYARDPASDVLPRFRSPADAPALGTLTPRSEEHTSELQSR